MYPQHFRPIGLGASPSARGYPVLGRGQGHVREDFADGHSEIRELGAAYGGDTCPDGSTPTCADGSSPDPGTNLCADGSDPCAGHGAPPPPQPQPGGGPPAPPPAPPPGTTPAAPSSSMTPWLVAGLGVLALGGVAFAVSRKRTAGHVSARRRGREEALENPVYWKSGRAPASGYRIGRQHGSDNQWYASVTLPDGRRKKTMTGFDSRAAAAAWARQYMRSHGARENPVAREPKMISGYAYKKVGRDWEDVMVSGPTIERARFVYYTSMDGHRWAVFKVGRTTYMQLAHMVAKENPLSEDQKVAVGVGVLGIGVLAAWGFSRKASAATALPGGSVTVQGGQRYSMTATCPVAPQGSPGDQVPTPGGGTATLVSITPSPSMANTWTMVFDYAGPTVTQSAGQFFAPCTGTITGMGPTPPSTQPPAPAPGA